MKHTLIRILALVALAAALAGCKEGKKRSLLPNVSGKAGEVVVVIEREQWEGALGVALREALASDTPYLAQREPLFNLSNVPPGNFTNLFKMHRNLLLVNIDPQNVTSGIQYKNNVWAQPQAVAQINAVSAEEALALFQESVAVVPEFFEQAERERNIANAKLYEELALREPVEKVTGGMELEFFDPEPVEYKCYCTRDRVEAALISLGREELGQIVDEGKDIQISCQFCDTEYKFTPADVAALLANA